MLANYPLVQSILSRTSNHFHRRVSKRTGTCRGSNMLAKLSGTHDKALLCRNDEVPKKGDPGSDSVCGHLWNAADSGVPICKWSLVAVLYYATTLYVGFVLQHHRVALCF